MANVAQYFRVVHVEAIGYKVELFNVNNEFLSTFPSTRYTYQTKDAATKAVLGTYPLLRPFQQRWNPKLGITQGL